MFQEKDTTFSKNVLVDEGEVIIYTSLKFVDTMNFRLSSLEAFAEVSTINQYMEANALRGRTPKEIMDELRQQTNTEKQLDVKAV